MIKEGERIVKYIVLEGDGVSELGVAFLSTYTTWGAYNHFEIYDTLPLSKGSAEMTKMLHPEINIEALRYLHDDKILWHIGISQLLNNKNEGFYYRHMYSYGEPASWWK